MIIERIGIESFAGLKSLELSFDRAINILEGPNEAGKSRVAAFICFIFYGFEGAPDERARYADSTSDRFACGWLELSSGERRFRVRRVYNGSGRGLENEVVITDLDKNAAIRGNDPAKLFLGVDRGLFERSSFMAQLKSREISGKELSAAIENMLSSANESINAGKGVKALSDRLSQLEGEDGKSGLIRENDEKIKDLDARIERALADAEEEKRLTEALNDNKKKLSTNRRENEECTKLFEHAERKKKLERLKTAGIALKRKNAAQEKLDGLREAHTENGFCPDAVYLRQIYDLNELVKKAGENEARASEAEARAKETYASLPEMPKGKKGRLFDAIENCRMRAQQSKNIFFFCFGAAGLLLVASVLLFIFAGVLWGIIGVCAAVAALGVGGLFLSRTNAARQEEARLYKSVGATGKEELSEALEKYAELGAKRTSLEKQIEEYGERAAKERDLTEKLLEKASVPAAVWGKTVKNAEDLDALFAQAQSVVSEILRAQDERDKADEILRASGENFTESELHDLLEKQRNDGVKKELTPEEYKNIQMKLRFYAQTIEGLGKRIEAQNAQLSALRARAEDSEELREKCESCRAKGEELRKEAFVVRSARQSLLETVEHMRASILPAVLDEASEFLHKATAEKYDGFEIGDSFEVRVKSKNGALPVSVLSGGTAELCYVALRLGVSARLYGEPVMPYLFDESFAFFDDLRKVSAYMAIADLAKAGKGQFFILTCRKRDSALFEKICPVNIIEF